LAFENTRENDYVTEKIWHGYLSGTVPVYWGAPNIDKYLPAPNSIIKVDDFSGPKELADYLKLVGSNPELYNSYLEWKKEKILSKNYIKLFKNSKTRTCHQDGFCRLCEFLRIQKLHNIMREQQLEQEVEP